MTRQLILCFFLFISFHSLGQIYHGKSTLNNSKTKDDIFIKPLSKDNYAGLSYLSRNRKGILYAKYFQKAIFSDDIVYCTIQVKEDAIKIWARLLFESKEIKLYQYRDRYFIEVSKTITEITNQQISKEVQLPIELRNNWDKTFQSSQSSQKNKKLMKKALKGYHNDVGISYKHYFKTPSVLLNFEIGAGLCFSKASINIPGHNSFQVNYTTPSIFVNKRLYMAQFLGQSYFSLGINLQKHNLTKDYTTHISGSKSIHDIDLQFYQLAFPLQLNLHLIRHKGFSLYARLGMKLYMNSSNSGTITSEYIKDNTVRTTSNNLELSKNTNISTISGLVLEKQIGKRNCSFSFVYVNFSESISRNSTTELVFNKSTINFSAAIKL